VTANSLETAIARAYKARNIIKIEEVNKVIKNR